jgi:hypothetical protein
LDFLTAVAMLIVVVVNLLLMLLQQKMAPLSHAPSSLILI